ncbi:hypothetical protein WISP_124522 [Willisornis vidua]|uniref:Uncharacterized protein n=1 Tax=Willisornis vidua TaxID=1566151 RepID=A0ABQ9CXE9_9PASS|nr:hypothetical protein WISP_124522 [Willisornis vidua]
MRERCGSSAGAVRERSRAEDHQREHKSAKIPPGSWGDEGSGCTGVHCCLVKLQPQPGFFHSDFQMKPHQIIRYGDQGQQESSLLNQISPAIQPHLQQHQVHFQSRPVGFGEDTVISD